MEKDPQLELMLKKIRLKKELLESFAPKFEELNSQIDKLPKKFFKQLEKTTMKEFKIALSQINNLKD